MIVLRNYFSLRRKTKKQLKVFFLICCVLLVLAGALYASYAFIQVSKYCIKNVRTHFVPDVISVKLNEVYSQHIRDHLIAVINEHIRDGDKAAFDPEKLHKWLKEQCGVIHSLQWKYTSPKKAELSITGVVPWININNQYVLGEGTTLHSIEHFVEYDLGLLPVLMMRKIDLQSEVSSSFRTFLRTIPLNVWEEYTIMYEKPTYIELHPKRKGSTMLVVDEKSICDYAKLASGDKVYKDVQAREVMRSRGMRKTKQWFLDMRFDNRIVAKQDVVKIRGRG